MSGINLVIVIGRLGQDPEVKAVGQGATVCRINVATSEKWTKNGQSNEKTEWHRIVVWGKLAEICGKYLQKGSQAYFQGKLQTRSWEKSPGDKRYSTEIIVNKVEFLSRTTGKQESFENDASEQEPNFSEPENNDFGMNDFGPMPDGGDGGGNEDIPF